MKGTKFHQICSSSFKVKDYNVKKFHVPVVNVSAVSLTLEHRNIYIESDNLGCFTISPSTNFSIAPWIQIL